MTIGFTGLIVRIQAERRYNTVYIVYWESYCTLDETTCYKRPGESFKFKTTFRAILFELRINLGQFTRYKGVKLI